VIVYLDSSVLARCLQEDEDGHEAAMLVLDGELGGGRRVVLFSVRRADIEKKVVELVAAYGVRTLDTWHLAVPSLTVLALGDLEREESGLGSREDDQERVSGEKALARV
jgi:hypothetical protein